MSIVSRVFPFLFWTQKIVINIGSSHLCRDENQWTSKCDVRIQECIKSFCFTWVKRKMTVFSRMINRRIYISNLNNRLYLKWKKTFFPWWYSYDTWCSWHQSEQKKKRGSSVDLKKGLNLSSFPKDALLEIMTIYKQGWLKILN